MSEYYKDKWPEMHMKHLELIQNAITRMGTNSANLKNFAMLMIAAVIGLATSLNSISIIIFIIPIVFGFSILDAKYLQLERSFREHFDRVRVSKIDQQPDFCILPEINKSLLCAYMSWSVIGFYGATVVFLVIIAIVIPYLEALK